MVSGGVLVPRDRQVSGDAPARPRSQRLCAVPCASRIRSHTGPPGGGVGQAVFGVMLLAHAPTPAGWADDPAGDAQSLERLNRAAADEPSVLSGGGGAKSRYNGAVMGGGVGLGNMDEY
jgi:hypothetical protein